MSSKNFMSAAGLGWRMRVKNKQPPRITPVDINMPPPFITTPTQVVRVYGGLKRLWLNNQEVAMSCPLCGNINAREDLSFGGGLRIYCEPCGGFYRISSTLGTLAEGKTYDTERARARLKNKRETDRLEDQEPALGPDDKDLLIDA